MAFSARTAAAAAVALAVAGLGATWYFSQSAADDAFAQCRRGVAPAAGQIGGAFTLVNQDGKTVTDADVITKPSLVYFGYTYCPDVCPLDNARNAEAVTLLDERGYDVQPVFISVDTDRDTPETMREFAAMLHPKMIGLTGSPEQISAASKAYRTYFKVQDPGDPYTLIDHSTQSYLVFPKLGFVEFFNRDTTAEEMTESVACFVDAWKAQQ
ncbi:SCO family protein [Rhodobacter xanthinilyticus]|uniref:SCO family protein n=1 Tax=Rhodobacter xanthinilyticus TaxID=1850250 RepID=A0A1D9M899_9RHOB|nr:SCO family protein [Rhodobacter xanthinilyticus]AOZ67959.1 SCO family protein [Rhodobacter xanthinilyticus]